jgi:hypothetical protein
MRQKSWGPAVGVAIDWHFLFVVLYGWVWVMGALNS